MVVSLMAVLKRSIALFFSTVFFALPVFAFAQVYGGGNYGSQGIYGTGYVEVTTSNVTVSGGGGVVIGGPNGLGYINTNPTGSSTLIAPTITVASSTSSTITTAGSSTGGSSLTEAQIQSILSILASFGADQSVVDSVNASLHAGGSSSATFTRDLEYSMEGEDVKALQQYLNTHGFVLANYGIGSPGNETTYFGDATRYQLIQFQKANNIIPAAGYFGPKTRAFIGE